MGPYVYALGALTTLLCATLLLRGFLKSRQRLLLWSGLCFAGLTLSNVLLFLDLAVLSSPADLYLPRLATAAGAMALLVYGLVMESE
jgi:hypothetical protein